ncbi:MULTISPECIES: sel1 repeat family protein [Burkholderiaceae]|uniref:SEL1-like repeat protein n=1 Tax=Burkholderiaceae TaxID=119060 RepID=UPI001F03C233|nr:MULTISPECIES: sel1 repeat family protein [Burkholderiaceae]
MRRSLIALSIVCLLSACSKNENHMTQLPDVSAVRLKLAFTCTHEADHLPLLDPESEKLFQYGRYLEKKDGPKDFNDVARYYRIAAAYGHYKANHNLQILISSGSASSPDPEKESVDLAEQLVKAGVPSGYYDIAHYLLNGYGLQRDEDAARRYMRKAADLGNPDAQYYVANLLNPADMAPDIALQMFRCASDQGYAAAGNDLGVAFQLDRKFAEAAKAFQSSAKAGSSQSAFLLQYAFDAKSGKNELYAIGVEPDAERTRRYGLIGKFLDSNDGRNPKVPDIDRIVPLPPAKLPPWDGTFQWQKEQDAAVPPQKPSGELIDQLAKAKHLDPATGLPLSGLSEKTSQADESSNFAMTRTPIGTLASTGDICPEDGVWHAKLETGQAGDAQRRFLKGDTLPSLVVREPRALAFLDRMMGARQQVAKVAWELVAYIDQA